MLFKTLGSCLSRREPQQARPKFFDNANEDGGMRILSPYEQSLTLDSNVEEETPGEPNIYDTSVGYRSNKLAEQLTKKGNKFMIAAESLKGYTGLDSEGSDTESAKKIKFAEDPKTPTKSRDQDIENEIADLKGKVYKKSDWIKILKNDDLENTSTTELYASLRQGIPFELRPQIWIFLSSIEKNKKENPSNYYSELTKTECDEKIENQISLDLPRTFPNNIFFTEKSYDGKTRLHRILRAYANYDQTIGYAQGMNYIAASLLVILHPENYSDSQLKFYEKYEKEYEEDVFWIYVHLMKDKNWRSIYKPKFPKVYEMCNYLEKLLQSQLLDVYEAILDSGFTIFDLFHQAFISLLMTYVPLAIGKRILDMFLIDGEKLIFKVIIRALELCRKQILEIRNQMKMQNFIKNEMFALLLEKYKKRLYVLFPFPDAENF